MKTGYWLASQESKADLIQEALAQPSLTPLKNQIWSVPPKIKSFLWKALNGVVPVVDQIASRGLKIDSRCQCGMEGESINHVLFSCSLARQVWALSNFPTPVDGFDKASIYQNMFYVLVVGKNLGVPLEIRRSFPWIL